MRDFVWLHKVSSVSFRFGRANGRGLRLVPPTVPIPSLTVRLGWHDIGVERVTACRTGVLARLYSHSVTRGKDKGGELDAWEQNGSMLLFKYPRAKTLGNDTDWV
jgi:hypothetical protein